MVNRNCANTGSKGAFQEPQPAFSQCGPCWGLESPSPQSLRHTRVVPSSLCSSWPHGTGFRSFSLPDQVCLWEETQQHHPEYSGEDHVVL